MTIFGYSDHFLRWLAKRTPSVQARILRLNATGGQGDRLRGYHPHKRTTDVWQCFIGKREFIKRHGRAAWMALPRCCVEHDGHRKRISREAELDNLWLAPADSPARRAYKKNGKWMIPDQLPDTDMRPVAIRVGQS